jgi:hypothetical protein
VIDAVPGPPWTVCTADAAPVRKLASPWYVATIWYGVGVGPFAWNDVVSVAVCRFTPGLSAPVPSVTPVVASWNCTVPVGTPALGATGATTAVNVTGCLVPEGSGDVVSDIVVGAFETMRVTGDTEFDAKFPEALENDAANVCVPTASPTGYEIETGPESDTGWLPDGWPDSVNVTSPTGGGVEVTLVVSVTA